MLKLTLDKLHIEKDEKLAAYVEKKIGALDKYIPRQARTSAHAEVKIKKGPGRGKKQAICEVVVHLPKENITSTEQAATPEAAVDLVGAKLKNQLKRYKDKQDIGRGKRIIRRLKLRK